MAATKTASKNPTKGNDTPNTPEVKESEIARMKVDELRRRLKDRGVKGTAELKKPELVKKLIKAYVSDSKAKKSTSGSAKKSTSSSAKKSTSAKNPTKGNDTPNTPEVKESEIARMKVDELRRRLKDRGVKGTAELKKPDLVQKLIKAYVSDSKKPDSAKKSSGSKKTSDSKKSGSARSTLRTGKSTSSSLKYSQEITSTGDRPERAGRSLVTTDHAVIRQWAQSRKAVPATVPGTEHGDHLGVLRFDFPGYSGDTLTEVSWDEWLDTFDKRRLNFIYQEKLSSGKPSNFFQLESPDREDG